jgi:ribosomal protein S18 acetylase RimI-like enzyme
VHTSSPRTSLSEAASPTTPAGTNDAGSVTYAWRGALEDSALEALHARAFGHEERPRSWSDQLHAHSLGWVTATRAGRLVGFVNVAWDGHEHAVLLDTAVDTEARHAGIGTELVRRAVEGAGAAGCAWVHVDYDTALEPFYVTRCGFTPSAAAVRALRDS